MTLLRQFVMADRGKLMPLGLLALIAILGVGTEFRILERPWHLSVPVRQEPLQRAVWKADADAILATWNRAGATDTVRTNLAWDFPFIVEYVLFGLALVGILVPAERDGLYGWVGRMAVVAACFLLIAAASDVIENSVMLAVLGGRTFLQPIVFSAATLKILALIPPLVFVVLAGLVQLPHFIRWSFQALARAIRNPTGDPADRS
jgi:hypothetical protein